MSKPSIRAAEPLKRYKAFAVDMLVIVGLYAIVAAMADPRGDVVARWWVFAAFYFVYHLVFLAWRHGVTLGRQLQQIHVVSASGDPMLTPWQCLARASVRALPFALIQPGGLILPTSVMLVALALADWTLIETRRERRALTDWLAGTRVVDGLPLQPRTARSPISSVPPDRRPTRIKRRGLRVALAIGLPRFGARIASLVRRHPVYQ